MPTKRKANKDKEKEEAPEKEGPADDSVETPAGKDSKSAESAKDSSEKPGSLRI